MHLLAFYSVAPHIVIAGRFWPLSGATFRVVWKKKTMQKCFKKSEIQASNRLSLCRSKQVGGQVKRKIKNRIFGFWLSAIEGCLSGVLAGVLLASPIHYESCCDRDIMFMLISRSGLTACVKIPSNGRIMSCLLEVLFDTFSGLIFAPYYLVVTRLGKIIWRPFTSGSPFGGNDWQYSVHYRLVVTRPGKIT